MLTQEYLQNETVLIATSYNKNQISILVKNKKEIVTKTYYFFVGKQQLLRLCKQLFGINSL